MYNSQVLDKNVLGSKDLTTQQIILCHISHIIFLFKSFTHLQYENFAESVAYEWGGQGRGLIRYFFDDKKKHNTKVDMISLGFITPLDNAVLIRIDSATAFDYLEVDIVSLKMTYFLIGTIIVLFFIFIYTDY